MKTYLVIPELIEELTKGIITPEEYMELAPEGPEIDISEEELDSAMEEIDAS